MIPELVITISGIRIKASLASSAAAPALTLGCAPRCRLVWAMGNGASGGGSGHRV